MTPLYEKFHWYEPEAEQNGTPQERYQRLVDWASHARGINPGVFDEVTRWLWGGADWSGEELSRNRKIFMDEIVGRFLRQNRMLEAELKALEPSGVVNSAVFGALKRFDSELSGESGMEEVREAVAQVFRDFSALKESDIREAFAGGITGPEGTDSVEVYGYVNGLKDCDAGVQWTLFMPECVERQQDGFRVESFEYVKLPAVRFIGMGRELPEGMPDLEVVAHTLDAMESQRSGFDYDLLLAHHFGMGVDARPCRLVWGRFMRAGAPVPEGFEAVDFLPRNDGERGPAYLPQFAFAKFTGDEQAMHCQEGFDSDAMYDVTRNIILGQGVLIPYPDKYWTAEVFLNGFAESSSAYLFSVDK